MTPKTRPGYPYPFGATSEGTGVQFALFSRDATAVSLLLFEATHARAPFVTIPLDPRTHRTGDIWHVWVEGIGPDTLYAYRVDGPYDPATGHRFNRHKLLLDPHARAVTRKPAWDFLKAKGYDVASPEGDLSFSTVENINAVPRCIVTNDAFDWKDDVRPRTPWSETIIYETHVRGLTVHPSSGVRHPGTFKGLIEKIPYLKELGVTAVELLPIQEFNEQEIYRANPLTGAPLTNYWGYSTVAFFAPKAGYAAGKGAGEQVTEFKVMVQELHRAGIEVILDIVFNHTAEGNEVGPTLSFRGLGNTIYYILQEDRRLYQNFTGCGNTVNCNHPVVRKFIVDCLSYWVAQMHVDGFRFDLASVLGRDAKGEMLHNPPLLEDISENPLLRGTKLIAEAWDAAGAYQVGSFQNHLWSEWNGQYRDDVRRFWRGDPGYAGLLASRICGSADIYQKSGKEPLNSINFITCHDGFTLNDLMSYNEKHNEANGEENRDGSDHNYSFNHGVEGPTGNPKIEEARVRQIKNMLATLLISRGVPLILGGDEIRRTQSGNNNAFCQDNETSWYNWEFFQKNQEIHRFTKEMIAFRRQHKPVRDVSFYAEGDITWHGRRDGSPDWGPKSKSLSCVIAGDQDLCLMFHSGSTDGRCTIPAARPGRRWHLAVDTAKPCPDDIYPSGREPVLTDQRRYTLKARSMVILVGR
jgi:isoamylase